MGTSVHVSNGCITAQRCGATSKQLTMIRFILTTLFLTSCWTAYSQKIAITYYDSAWQLTTKAFGEYYRTGIIDTNRYQYYGEVKDYYMNGKPRMKGKFKANIKIDTFYFYYPSGNLMTKGLYENNIRSAYGQTTMTTEE